MCAFSLLVVRFVEGIPGVVHGLLTQLDACRVVGDVTVLSRGDEENILEKLEHRLREGDGIMMS